MARGRRRDLPRARVPAPLTPGHGGITSVGCSCDSARRPAGSSRTGRSTSSGRSRCSPPRTTPTGSRAGVADDASARALRARARPHRHRAHAARLHRAQRAGVGVGSAGSIDIASWLYINAQTSITLGALIWIYLRRNRASTSCATCSSSRWGSRSSATWCSRPRRRASCPSGASSTRWRSSQVCDHDSVTVNALFNPYAAVPSMHVALRADDRLAAGPAGQRRGRCKVVLGAVPAPRDLRDRRHRQPLHRRRVARRADRRRRRRSPRGWLARARPRAWAFPPHAPRPPPSMARSASRRP